MKWISDEYTQYVAKQKLSLLPSDFDFESYIALNPDLIAAEIDNEPKAIEHFLMFGLYENRLYKEYASVPINNYSNKYSAEIWNQTDKNLLYFAPMAPDYDMSSGGNRLLEILKILRTQLNYNIWFMCNSYIADHHLQALTDLDIPYFLPNIHQKKYLNIYLKLAQQKNLNFSNVIFSWYDIARQYLDMVKLYYPNIKVIVDSVDVHWIREQRGKDTGELNISQEAIDTRKNIEKETYHKANVVFAVTNQDQLAIKKEFNYNVNVKILSNIHTSRNTVLGKNIIFVGNYNHTPNIQAALESIKIYKAFQKTKIYKQLKNPPKLYLIGPNLDTKIVLAIKHNPNIHYLGQVKNLHQIYKQAKLLIAPLYWGAGIKGKICDCAMNNIPVLTSDIGNEGIELKHRSNGLIANSTEGFVKELKYFFSLSGYAQKKLGKNGQKHLNTIVSEQTAKNILQHTLEPKPILISIVTYNQPHKLIKCLDSILQYTNYKPYKIIITDNGGSTETPKLLKPYLKKYKHILYSYNITNEYFIVPNNKIMKNSEYKNYDIVLLNDDIEILSQDWLNHLYSAAYSADNICAAGGKTIFPDGRLAEAGAELYQNGNGCNKGRNQNPDDEKYNKSYYTGYCSGCLLYMRRDAINQIGYLSTELEHMYYEDSEWQYRGHIYGLKTIYEPRCVAIHHEGSSSGTDIHSGMKQYQEINRLKFIQIMRKLGCHNIEIYNQ